jgi:hypothetical protein
MRHVRVLITRRVDDHFPGWVEFTILGAGGEVFLFVDKDPVASAVDIPSFPFESTVACNVISAVVQPDGSKVVEIDTSPWGIESDAGVSRFLVHESQLASPQSAA